jgi:hypothetical protein
LKYDSLISNALRLCGEWTLNKINLWVFAGRFSIPFKEHTTGLLFAGKSEDYVAYEVWPMRLMRMILHKK